MLYGIPTAGSDSVHALFNYICIYQCLGGGSRPHGPSRKSATVFIVSIELAF